MLDGFTGVWVNEPQKDVRAGNKLFQLRAARACGFTVPKTLITQDPQEVRRFCEELNGELIVKKLVGASGRPLATVKISADDLDDASIAICPAIYQERIRGNRHLRVNCFGETVHALLIQSNVLDWRRDLSCPFSAYTPDPGTVELLKRLVKLLGLEMAVMDLMITEDSSLVWLELNPQGQFLFGEALSGYDLTSPFTDFLVEAASRAGSIPRVEGR